MAGTPFLKMHGLGNDFVVLDARTTPLDLTPPRRRAIADRRLGVGCDQLIVLEPPTEGEADVFMRIYNPDGTEAQACGNATRCVASVVMDELKAEEATIQTIAGLLESQKVGRGANGLPVTPLDTQLVGGTLPGQPQMLAGPSDMDQRLDIARIEGQVKASSIKKVADFVQSHPDEAAGILRTWVAEG